MHVKKISEKWSQDAPKKPQRDPKSFIKVAGDQGLWRVQSPKFFSRLIPNLDESDCRTLFELPVDNDEQIVVNTSCHCVDIEVDGACFTMPWDIELLR